MDDDADCPAVARRLAPFLGELSECSLSYPWKQTSSIIHFKISATSRDVLLPLVSNQSVTFIWMLTQMNIRIYLCQETRTNIQIYSYEIFWHERISKYIRMKILIRMNIRIYLYQNFDTNEYLNKYLDRKYSNVRIYSSHSGLDLHQFRAFTI